MAARSINERTHLLDPEAQADIGDAAETKQNGCSFNPALSKTVFASLAAAGFRTILTPVDTIKTTMQTDGNAGMVILWSRIQRHGISSLWYGAVRTAVAAFAGHYHAWFGTYNCLDETLPAPATVSKKLLQQACIGFAASVVSDSVSNSLRVMKTYRQVH